MITPQTLSVGLKQAEKRLSSAESRISILEAQNAELNLQMDELKEIVHKMLMTNHPEYRKKQALEGVDDFLRKRVGRTRPLIASQE